MATVNFMREFVDTWPPDVLVDGEITARSATQMTYTSEMGYRITWFGTGLTYDAEGFGAGGTVNRVLVTKGGVTFADFQGLDAAMQRMSMFAFGFDREPYLSPISSDSDYLFEHMMRGDDVITGTFRDDEINGGAGNDVISAGAGYDFVDINEGDDSMVGGAGWDTLSFENANWNDLSDRGVNLNAATGTLTDSWGGHDTIRGFEKFRDSLFNDTLVGSAEDEDFFITRGDDFVDGGGGGDILNFSRADNWGGTKGIALDLATGLATDSWGDTDHVTNIHMVVDTIFNDTLRGSDQADTFFSFSGRDFYDGRGDFDAVSFVNIDLVSGSHGVSVNLAYSKGEVRDDGFGNIENIANIELIAGSVYGDKLLGAGAADELHGLAGNDTLRGGGNDDVMSGGSGRDILRGGADEDTLSGDEKSDTLVGGAGDDVLRGGSGSDRLSGGDGADSFKFHSNFATTGVDTISDFVSRTDSLVLWADWIPGHLDVHLKFEQFRSGAGVTTANTADQRVIYNITTGDLYFDKDGAGGAAATKFAVLTDAPTLSFVDIWTTFA